MTASEVKKESSEDTILLFVLDVVLIFIGKVPTGDVDISVLEEDELFSPQFQLILLKLKLTYEKKSNFNLRTYQSYYKSSWIFCFFFAFRLESSNYWFFFQENTISSCAKERRMHFYHGWYYEFHLVIFKAKVALKLWGQSRFENSKTKVLHCGFLICEFYSYWQKYWNANQYLPLGAEHMIAISGHWLWPSAGVASCFRSEGQWNGTSF